MEDFTGQTIIVTGGTRGIGRSIVEHFLSASANVIATYNSNDDDAMQLKKDNDKYSSNLDIQKFDVSNYEEVEIFYKYIEEHYKAITVLVHCSGIRRDSILGMMKFEDWEKVLNVNLTGTFNMCKFSVMNMMRQRYGRIIIITSPAAQFGFYGQANYSASKAGQIGLMRSLSKEVATRKITVNCISPGFIETDFIADLNEKQRKEYLATIPLKHFGKPEDIAYSVLFLASKQANYITGTVLEVTGGL